MAKNSRIVKPEWSVVIPNSLYTELMNHLFPGDNDEHGAILTAGTVRTDRGNKLLVRDVFLAKDGIDYIEGIRSYRSLNANFIHEKIRYCHDEQLSYIAVHCHQGNDEVSFSPIDIASHEKGYPALLDIIEGQSVGALVFATNAAAGIIWLPTQERVCIKEVIIIGNSISHLYPRQLKFNEARNKRFDRQSMIFGEKGQKILSAYKVGIIGAGGAGSMINEYLARLGVGHIVIADDDYIDETNLPRVVGSTVQDIETKKSKVVIAKRVAKNANQKVLFNAIQGNICEKNVVKHFIDCDYIFLAADSMQARLVFNSLIHQYLIPGIQVGVKVEISKGTGNIQDIFCVSRPITPDEGCLLCNELISYSRLQEEAISTAELDAQKYVNDPDVVAPSVITLNAISVALAVNHFLFSTTGLLDKSDNQCYLRLHPLTSKLWQDQPRKSSKCIECGRIHASRFARGDSVLLPIQL